ncbi:hypothetical protein F6X40_25630 [Paraburkholderia sp. UCT31]|uniref:hypothetical protein n=1 Tax=Paraburkholderia sp. UCT31 TaxID=2615209 RepID=UPI00165581DA|nr:hypothetical protein [Paraburkholderia sp. UCT31]MBC8740078.1 hypothetical protein [Paraburkholderia sp. UCT31]
MNWHRLYATAQTWFVVALASIVSSGFYTVVVIGVCRRVVGLSDNVSIFAIGLPFFVVLLFVFASFLPKPLRKAGMLSDDPEKFGPWFKRDGEA